MIEKVKISFSFAKLYPKVMIPFGIVLFAFIFVTIYTLDNKIQLKIKERNIADIFRFCETELEYCFNYYYDVSKNYNTLFNNYDLISNTNRRSFYHTITKSTIDNNKNIRAIWADFDANKLDGLDSYYKNTEYYSHDGRFSICWNRENNFDEELHYFSYSDTGYLTHPSIAIPKTTKMPTIINPLMVSSVEELDVSEFIFSFCFPVFNKKKDIIGVTGIDVDVKLIMEVLDKSKVDLVDEFVILSKEGYYFTHSNDKLLGKNIADNDVFSNYNIDSILTELSNNRVVITEVLSKKDNGIRTVIYYPIIVKTIQESQLYVAIALKNEIVEFDSSLFIEQVLQYCILFLLCIFIVTFFIVFGLENILINKMIREISDKELKNTTNLDNVPK